MHAFKVAHAKPRLIDVDNILVLPAVFEKVERPLLPEDQGPVRVGRNVDVLDLPVADFHLLELISDILFACIDAMLL